MKAATDPAITMAVATASSQRELGISAPMISGMHKKTSANAAMLAASAATVSDVAILKAAAKVRIHKCESFIMIAKLPASPGRGHEEVMSI